MIIITLFNFSLVEWETKGEEKVEMKDRLQILTSVDGSSSVEFADIILKLCKFIGLGMNEAGTK